MIKVKDIKMVPLSEIKLNPKNRNKHPKDQIDRLVAIIKYQGFRRPVTISNRSGFLSCGEGRYLAAKKLKLDAIPAMFQDYESEEQEYADGIADNTIDKWAELDIDLIKSDVIDFKDFDLNMLGIKDFSLDLHKFEPGCDEDEIPEQPETRCKLGNIWTLGNHRLMCGDSTSIDSVEKLMNGEKADITFTSPPYNAAKNGHLTGIVAGFDKKYQNHSDKLSDDEYLKLLCDFTGIAIAKSKYCFVNIQLLTHNRIALFKYQQQFQSMIKDILIWNKKQCPPNIVKGAFNTKWEYIFCFSEDTKTRGFPCDWRGQFPNVVETESNSANEFAETHKAGFPVSLPVWFIEKFDFAKTIYDPFGGTGTTLIACEKTNRKCFMMELDPHYCDVIIARWENYTGKTAKLSK